MEYYYKDAGVNARHPDNEAETTRGLLEALQTIRRLRNDSGVRFRDGKPTSWLCVPGGRGVRLPTLSQYLPDGPGDMVQLYGPGNGASRRPTR